MIYFSSDFHLGHFNIIKYCTRPFKTIDEMNKTIIDNWNRVVTPDDTAILLGDLAFGKHNLDLIRYLNGRKLLVRGNHDRGFSDSQFKKVGIDLVFKKPQIFSVKVDKNSSFEIVYCMHAPNQFRNDAINLCGHVHDRWKIKQKYLNVGVDQWEFAPVSLKQVLDVYNSGIKDVT